MLHDLLIVGGGCAGLGAAIYARRFNMDVLVLTEGLGGTITTTHLVENYPGFISLTRQELADKLIDPAKANNVEFKIGQRVSSIKKEGEIFKAKFHRKSSRHELPLATEPLTKTKRAGERIFRARVSYRATCDAGFFKKKCDHGGRWGQCQKESLILARRSRHHVYRGENHESRAHQYEAHGSRTSA